MTRRWVAVLTVVALSLAGCSGSDDSPEPAPETRTATPASHSLDDLAAALPAAKDLPGGLTLTRACPSEDKGCDMYPEGLVVAEIEAEPASPAGAEQIQTQATPKDFVAVQAQTYVDAAAATEAVRVTWDDLDKFTGTYEVTQGKGRTSRGKGTLDELEIGAWTGLAHRRTEVSSDAETDKGLLIATTSVAGGPHRLTAFVSLSAAGRDPDAAAELADRLLRDYIERLDRPAGTGR